MSDQHPTVPTWTPEPPPATRRRLGPGIVAGCHRRRAAVRRGRPGRRPPVGQHRPGRLLARGGRRRAAHRPRQQDLDRPAGYLDAEERLLLATYRDRVTALLAGRMTGPTGQPLSGLQLTARDIRFQRVAGLGGADVAVVELAGGTVGGRDASGAKLELPAAELNRRLADQSKGAVKALRVVAVRDRRPLAGLAARLRRRAGGRLAAGAGRARLGPARRRRPAGRRRRRLARGGRARAGRRRRPRPAGRPRAALAGRAARPGRLRVAAGPPRREAGRRSTCRVEGLETRTEEVADGVARVRATAGRLVGGMLQRVAAPRPGRPPRARRRTSSPSSGTGRGIHPWCSPSPTGCCNRAERERP